MTHEESDGHSVTSPNQSQTIVGIDFGATYTAAAYAVSNSENSEPILLDKWPKAAARSACKLEINPKIDTIVYFNQYQKIVGWDHDKDDALAPRGYPLPGVQVMTDFRYNFASIPNTDLPNPPLPPGKTIEEIVAGFLGKVRESICAQITAELNLPDVAEQSLRYVVTVPASWDENTLTKLSLAAKDAGFRPNPENIQFVSGIEAAILQAISSDPSAFKVGDNVLVADCGGHVVETVTYKVISKSPLRIERLTDICAGACGTSRIFQRLITMIREQGKCFRALGRPGKFIAQCIRWLRNELIPKFGEPGLLIPHIEASENKSSTGYFSVDVGIEADFPEANVYDGYLWISNEDVHSCFDPEVESMLKLFEEQFEAMKSQDLVLDSCVLVGGSLMTPYISEKVHALLSSHGLKIVQRDLRLACVKGAVLAGLRDGCN